VGSFSTKITSPGANVNVPKVTAGSALFFNVTNPAVSLL
jgi:hypothetical protein